MAYGITHPGILGAIGHTPFVHLSRVMPREHARVSVKFEFLNPLSWVKGRIGRAMVEAFEQCGDMNRRCHKAESASVNTGTAATLAARLAACRENAGKAIVTFAFGSGERYSSTPLYELVGMTSLPSALVA